MTKRATGSMSRRSTMTTIDLLPGLTAFSTLRGCTDPEAPYDGFNACHYTGDSPLHVEACRAALGPDIVIPRQTHSLNVAYIDSPGMPEGVDALVTTRPGLLLCVHTADCVPLVMADREAGVIAAVHSGWRGTVGRIAALALRRMVIAGADPRRVVAAMGPCICPDCFEVGPEVAQAFRDAGLAEAILPREPRPHIDLPLAVRLTLMAEGVADSAIAPPVGCSRCRPDLWFSARRLGVNSGRTLTAIALPSRP